MCGQYGGRDTVVVEQPPVLHGPIPLGGGAGGGEGHGKGVGEGEGEGEEVEVEVRGEQTIADQFVTETQTPSDHTIEYTNEQIKPDETPIP